MVELLATEILAWKMFHEKRRFKAAIGGRAEPKRNDRKSTEK